MSNNLTLWERMFYEMNVRFSGHNSLVLKLGIDGVFDRELFIRVIEALFRRHPRLRARIQETDQEPVVDFQVGFSQIPVIFHGEVSLGHFEKIYQAEFDRKVETDQYAWRAQYCQVKDGANYLLLTFSHALADGLSVYAICQDFLRIANHMATGAYRPEPLELVSLEEVSEGQDEKPVGFVAQHFFWPYQAVDRGVAHRSTGNITVRMNADGLSAVKVRLKQEGLSINDFLNGVLIKLISENRPNEVKDEVVLHTPVSLRGLAGSKIGAEHVLCATRLVNTYHNIAVADARDVFSSAKDYKRQLVEKIKRQQEKPADEVNTVGQLSTYLERCRSKRDGFFMGFCISNLGVVRFSEEAEDRFRANEFLFASNRMGSDCVMFINVVAYNGELQLTFNFTQPALNPEWVKKFSQQFLDEIYVLNKASQFRASLS